MDQLILPDIAEIRSARVANPKMREWDLASQLGISEAGLVAAHCGEGVVRIEPRVNDVLSGLEAVGEVMALTRNESAVHEKIGIYDKVVTGANNALVLGSDIDLRIFPKKWAAGFAVEKKDDTGIRRSLQFFDAAGEAVHKVHLRPSSNLYAFQKLVGTLEADDQRPGFMPVCHDEEDAARDTAPVDVDRLRQRWSEMTDVHQFFGLLRSLKLDRRDAVRHVGPDYAWRLDNAALAAMMHEAAAQGMPIMCFVGNRGCIQIHSGPITTVKPMGPWLNVMDDTFHLHLRIDHVDEFWAVRKPTKDGHVTSLEAYGADGTMFIQFFGKRHEGESELRSWRDLVGNLPGAHASNTAA